MLELSPTVLEVQFLVATSRAAGLWFWVSVNLNSEVVKIIFLILQLLYTFLNCGSKMFAAMSLKLIEVLHL